MNGDSPRTAKAAWHALAMGYCFKVPRSSPIKLGYVRGVSVATSHVPLSIFRLCQAAKRAKVNPARGIALVRKNSRALTLSGRLTSGGRLLDPKADMVESGYARRVQQGLNRLEHRSLLFYQIHDGGRPIEADSGNDGHHPSLM
ncbi:hypothetical protein Purlil1_10112 [Purpureocillium lilacinum]|uniref:Uncharacterized protein n=1 Tax=Purpureocillium lilacinum TaxID=33203 RepID=A0ABR0BNH7_PURLI|nr:hypothetical protein Purlil1_10112 [Purpureocillium lilacinum]